VPSLDTWVPGSHLGRRQWQQAEPGADTPDRRSGWDAGIQVPGMVSKCQHNLIAVGWRKRCSGAVVGLVGRELTEKIIGAAYAVHHGLGSGFLEKVYEFGKHNSGQQDKVSC